MDYVKILCFGSWKTEIPKYSLVNSFCLGLRAPRRPSSKERASLPCLVRYLPPGPSRCVYGSWTSCGPPMLDSLHIYAVFLWRSWMPCPDIGLPLSFSSRHISNVPEYRCCHNLSPFLVDMWLEPFCVSLNILWQWKIIFLWVLGKILNASRSDA